VIVPKPDIAASTDCDPQTIRRTFLGLLPKPKRQLISRNPCHFFEGLPTLKKAIARVLIPPIPVVLGITQAFSNGNSRVAFGVCLFEDVRG
jgi:hypothetical protein